MPLSRAMAKLAEQLMLSHLDHIQGSLRLEADADDADLEQILGDL